MELGVQGKPGEMGLPLPVLHVRLGLHVRTPWLNGDHRYSEKKTPRLREIKHNLFYDFNMHVFLYFNIRMHLMSHDLCIVFH